MKLLLSILFCLILQTSFLLFSNLAKAELGLVDSNDIFQSETHNSGQLSPEGSFFSFIKRQDQELVLSFIYLENENYSDHLQGLKLESGVIVNEYYWISDDAIFVEVTNRGYTEMYIMTVKMVINDGKKTLDTNLSDVTNGYIVDTLIDEPELIMFAKYERDGKAYEQAVYAIAIDDLINNNFENAELIERGPLNLVNFSFDSRSSRFIGTFYNEKTDEVSFKFKSRNTPEWTPLYSFEDSDFEMQAVGFINDDHFAVLTNKDADRVGLYEFNIKDKKLGKLIFEHPQFDLSSAILSEDGQPLGIEYFQGGFIRTQWLNSYSRELVERVNLADYEGVAQVIGGFEPKARWLIFEQGPNNPGRYYLFDGRKKQTTKLLSMRPQVDNTIKPRHEIIEFTDANKIQQEAYLTLPTKLNHNTLIVMPQVSTGSIGDSSENQNLFKRNVQYLANRGFSFLRANVVYPEQNNASETILVSQDATAIEVSQELRFEEFLTLIERVRQKYNFKNVCLMGMGLNAGISVRLSISNPELFDCVIAMYGLYDLRLIIDKTNIQERSVEGTVSKVFEKNKSELQENSAFYLSPKLQLPILILAGKQDKIVGLEQSNRLRYVLQKLNKDVSYIAYERAGFGQKYWYEQKHENAYIVEFLREKLDLPYTHNMQLSKSDINAIINDYRILGNVFSSNRFTLKKSEKALEYFQKASDLGDPRSTFNLATRFQTQEFRDIPKMLTLYERAASLEFAPSYLRLARLYAGFDRVERDEDKVYKYIYKSIDHESTFFKRLFLARFLCTAGEKYKDFEQCIETIKEHRNQIKNREDRSTLFATIANIIVSAKFSEYEKKTFGEFASRFLGIDHAEFEFEILSDGYYKYTESDNFNENGSYKLLSADSLASALSISGNDKLTIGIAYDLDHAGFSSHSEYMFTVSVLEVFDSNGKRVDTHSNYLKGTGFADWASRFNVTHEEGNTYRLKIFDLNSRLIFEQMYK